MISPEASPYLEGFTLRHRPMSAARWRAPQTARDASTTSHSDIRRLSRSRGTELTWLCFVGRLRCLFSRIRPERSGLSHRGRRVFLQIVPTPVQGPFIADSTIVSVRSCVRQSINQSISQSNWCQSHTSDIGRWSRPGQECLGRPPRAPLDRRLGSGLGRLADLTFAVVNRCLVF